MAIVTALLLLIALWLDRRWGEPRAALHPVVWMGKYLQLFGRLTTRLPPAPAFVLGAFFWCLGAAVIFLLASALEALMFLLLLNLLFAPGAAAGAGALLLTVLFTWLLKTTFAWRMLREEALAVEAALQQSLQAGRARLAMLVSRDTAELDDSAVRESAIESLAENLNDSVVAPLFWFVFLGLPGALVYRFANTADAMWGYPGLRQGINWAWAGKWAARADDVLSWLPARLTALLLALVARGVHLRTLREEARKTPSPNSGWPMAAMALALQVRLCKPGVYVLNAQGRPPEAVDMPLAIRYASKVLVAQVLLALIAIISIAFLSAI